MDLKEIQVCITSICKIGCNYCHLNKDGENMSLETFKNIIKTAKKNNISAIRLTGGNIFEHPNLIQFLEIIKKNNLKSIVNISIITIKKIQKILKYSNYILFSFHNIKQFETYKNELIELKQNKNVYLMGCAVFENKWIKNLKELSNQIEKLDTFFFLRDTNKTDKKYFQNLNECIERSSQISQKIKYANGFPLCLVSQQNIKLCSGSKFDNGNEKIYIKPNGIIKPSAYSKIELGNINEPNNISQIWQNNQNKTKNILNSIELCKKCKIKNYCENGILTIEDYNIDPLFKHVYYNKYTTKFQEILKQKLFKIKNINDLKILYHENSSFYMQYPPSNYWENTTEKFIKKNLKLKKEKLSLYIHFPFCNANCKFCNVEKFKHFEKEKHLKKILDDIEKYKPIIENNEIISVYFGGGSPQLMGKEGAQMIFEKLFSLFKNKPKEVNFELYPKNYDKELIKYIEKYVTRISIGIQCLDENNLKKLNRITSKKEIIEFVEKIKNHNFKELNLDVIYGLFMNNPDKFKTDFLEILNLKPTHITYQPLHFTKELEFEDKSNNIANQILLNTLGRKILEKKGFNQNSAEDFSLREKLIYQSAMLKQKNLLGIGKNTFSFINNSYYKNENENYFFYKLKEKDKLFGKLFLASRFLRVNYSKLNEKFNINYKSEFSDSIKILLKYNFIKFEQNKIIITKEGNDYVDLISNIFSLNNLDYKLK